MSQREDLEINRQSLITSLASLEEQKSSLLAQRENVDKKSYNSYETKKNLIFFGILLLCFSPIFLAAAMFSIPLLIVGISLAVVGVGCFLALIVINICADIEQRLSVHQLSSNNELIKNTQADLRQTDLELATLNEEYRAAIDRQVDEYGIDFCPDEGLTYDHDVLQRIKEDVGVVLVDWSQGSDTRVNDNDSLQRLTVGLGDKPDGWVIGDDTRVRDEGDTLQRLHDGLGEKPFDWVLSDDVRVINDAGWLQKLTAGLGTKPTGWDFSNKPAVSMHTFFREDNPMDEQHTPTSSQCDRGI